MGTMSAEKESRKSVRFAQDSEMNDDDDDDDEGSKKKSRFGDEMGRIGRRRKGAGKLYDEEAQRFTDNADDVIAPVNKRKRDVKDLNSSMQTGRDLKEIEAAAEDWEHSEDSGEEEYRRKYIFDLYSEL